jgi:putative membrane protein
MADSPIATSAGRLEVRATADSHFGWIRTRLIVERTMMSWQRTATALIGIGFAIVQYLQHLQQVPGVRSQGIDSDGCRFTIWGCHFLGR